MNTLTIAYGGHGGSQLKQFGGLVANVNPWVRAPEGSMDIADNLVIRAIDVLEPRRGYSAALAGTPIHGLGFKQGYQLLLTFDDNGVQYPGQLRAYNPSIGSITTLPMNPGGLTIDRPGASPYIRSRFVPANLSTYFQSRYGLAKIEDVSLGVCRAALQPKNWTAQVPVANGVGTTGATSTSGTWLSNGFQVAYRFTIARTGSNGELIESEPSERLLVSNTAGGARAVLLTLATSWMMPPGSYFRIWRSSQIANGVDPSDEMFLVAEVKPTGTADANGFLPQTTTAYTDQSPDSAIYIPLYTNPQTGEGILQANNPAPLSADMAFFKGRQYYLDTTDVQRIILRLIGTGAGGIQDGDTLTVGTTFTFRASPSSSPTSTDIKLYTAGTVSQNLENTARTLTAVVNNYYSRLGATLPTTVFASYISTGANDAGQVLLQSLVPGAPAFTVRTSSSSGWGTDYTTAVSSSPNTQAAGLMWSKFDQPEAVPLSNSDIVGDASAAGLRLIPLRESMFAFKDDGLWRIADDGSSLGPSISLFDPTVHLLAPDTAVAIDNVILGLCDQGVLLMSEMGKLNVSQDNIGRELEALILRAGADAVARLAFAVGYESTHEYVLCLPDGPGATACSVQYVFNLHTKTWTRWRLPALLCGGLDPNTGSLSWGAGQNTSITSLSNTLWTERKNGDSSDYQDPGFSITSPASTATATLVFTGQPAIEVGDVLQQAQATYFLQQRVISVSYASGASQTTVTLDAAPAHPWTLTAISVLKAIKCVSRFLALHADHPLIDKGWGDAMIGFRYCDLAFITVGWASEVYQLPNVAQEQIAGTTDAPIVLQSWAPSPWGQSYWGRQTKDVVMKLSLPDPFQYAAVLVPTITVQNALARFEMSTFGVSISGVTDKAVR